MITFNQLNESHTSIPQKILDMTVEELLNTIWAISSEDAAKAYEIIEGQIEALQDDITGDSYLANPGDTDVDSVEGEEEVDFTPDGDDSDIPTFGQSDDRYDRNSTDVTNNNKADYPGGNIDNYRF
jgi:hypothetical protein